ncbi:membrane peptidoglycan carboxypeptidase [Bradyrhizobium sp. LM6.11]
MRVVKTLLLVLVVAALAPYVIAPFYRIGHPVSTLMAWRSLRAAPMQREWIDLAAMSPSLPRSVVAAEDAQFLQASRHRLGRAA